MNETALRETIQSYKDKNHVYGKHDCCQFIAHYLLLVTGFDYRHGFEYCNKKEAETLINRFGTLHKLLCQAFGKSKKYLQPGDIALVMAPDRVMHVGIYNGFYVIGMTDNGVSRILPTNSVRGWHVG